MPLRPAARLALLLAALAAPLADARAACQVDLRPVAFGVVDLSRRTTGTGRVVVSCDAATRFEVAIDRPSGGRRMLGPGGAVLRYELYQDAALARVWSSGGNARSGSANGQTQTRLTVYGAVPPQSGPPPGPYADQVRVTLTY